VTSRFKIQKSTECMYARNTNNANSYNSPVVHAVPNRIHTTIRQSARLRSRETRRCIWIIQGPPTEAKKAFYEFYTHPLTGGGTLLLACKTNKSLQYLTKQCSATHGAVANWSRRRRLYATVKQMTTAYWDLCTECFHELNSTELNWPTAVHFTAHGVTVHCPVAKPLRPWQ